MFSECTSLIELNISSFNNKKEIDIDDIFSGCSCEFIKNILAKLNNEN